jgi:hypothetical protein
MRYADPTMSWEERARKLEAKRRYMPKHGRSVFVMDAAERKRIALLDKATPGLAKYRRPRRKR